MFRGMFQGRIGGDAVGGVIPIAQIAYEAASAGWTPFIHFLGVLSVSLAVLNFLPIPPLDGGQFTFLADREDPGQAAARVGPERRDDRRARLRPWPDPVGQRSGYLQARVELFLTEPGRPDARIRRTTASGRVGMLDRVRPPDASRIRDNGVGRPQWTRTLRRSRSEARSIGFVMTSMAPASLASLAALSVMSAVMATTGTEA